MHSKNNISKVATFIVVALLFCSFTAKFHLDVKDWKKIEKNIKLVLNIESPGFSEIKNIPNSGTTCFFKIDDLGYLAIDQAPSKFHKFEYYILFNAKGEILKVEVLNYNENYGTEICSKRWLKQFYKINTSSFFSFNNSVDAISGATLSVQSISSHIWKVTGKLESYLEKE